MLSLQAAKFGILTCHEGPSLDVVIQTSAEVVVGKRHNKNKPCEGSFGAESCNLQPSSGDQTLPNKSELMDVAQAWPHCNKRLRGEGDVRGWLYC